MKKLILALCLTSLALSLAAQQTVVVKKVQKGDEPKAVVDAIKRDFPEAVTKNLSYLPAKLYGEEWNVALRDEAGSGEYKYFVVNMKQENQDYTAVYDEDGTLLSSKRIIRNVPLPEPVAETLKRFSGWHIDKTHEIIQYKRARTTDTYKVKIQKKGEHKVIFLDAEGNILDTRMGVI